MTNFDKTYSEAKNKKVNELIEQAKQTLIEKALDRWAFVDCYEMNKSQLPILESARDRLVADGYFSIVTQSPNDSTYFLMISPTRNDMPYEALKTNICYDPIVTKKEAGKLIRLISILLFFGAMWMLFLYSIGEFKK